MGLMVEMERKSFTFDEEGKLVAEKGGGIRALLRRRWDDSTDRTLRNLRMAV